jgi:hypothetical protein
VLFEASPVRVEAYLGCSVDGRENRSDQLASSCVVQVGAFERVGCAFDR